MEIFEINERYVPCCNILVLFVVILLTKILDIGRIYQYLFKERNLLKYVFLLCGILAILFVVIMCIKGKFSALEVLLLFFMFSIVILCFYQWKWQRNTIERNLEQIKWLEQCNDSFEQLITDVRSRQHDFNNQIDAICGLRYSCNTYEELVTQLGIYTDKLIRENKFNKLLFLDCPPLVKGFLYYRFCRAYKEGITIDYDIVLDSIVDVSAIFGITQIVGVLFDNACEALSNDEKKKIYMKINQSESEIYITVENVSRYISYEEISMFVKKGYSTKDKLRGYGLYNVKKIAKKFNGVMSICNVEKVGENWLQIAVQMHF